jgi:adenosylcobinamide-phosphate synthase
LLDNLPDIIWPMAVFILALLWDITLGEPRIHPVVGMGKAITFLGQRAPRQGKVWPFLYGLGMALFIPAAFAIAAYATAKGALLLHPALYVIVGAYLLKGCFSVRGLDKAATSISRRLEGGHLEDARSELRSLVSRDTAGLSPELTASAAVESVAENTADSFVGPWLAFALLGLPGVVAYRAINTLDSMIGYHHSYEYLGKASARLDDLVNIVPARLSALFILAAGYVRSFSHPLASAWRVVWQQRSRTSSPNAGWTMAAMAGTLGVVLHKVGYYKLGRETSPDSSSIKEAVRVMYGVAALASALALGLLVLRYYAF